MTRDAVSDVLWRWIRLDNTKGRGLRGGTFTTSPPDANGDYHLHLDAIKWTNDTTVTGDITTHPANHSITGVVDVSTNLAYQNASAAGTGMVLTSSGEVLTNNHVIRGATTIRVTDPSTKRSYAATVGDDDSEVDAATGNGVFYRNSKTRFKDITAEEAWDVLRDADALQEAAA